jgi:hypothetical protein
MDLGSYFLVMRIVVLDTPLHFNMSFMTSPVSIHIAFHIMSLLYDNWTVLKLSLFSDPRFLFPSSLPWTLSWHARGQLSPLLVVPFVEVIPRRSEIKTPHEDRNSHTVVD